jgi:hypothetical protein
MTTMNISLPDPMRTWVEEAGQLRLFWQRERVRPLADP